METSSGIYTGDAKTNMALLDVKQAVVDSLIQFGKKKASSFAFGDSESDLPLLNAVDNPFVLTEPNRDKGLVKIAQEKGWSIVDASTILTEVKRRIFELKEKNLI